MGQASRSKRERQLRHAVYEIADACNTIDDLSVDSRAGTITTQNGRVFTLDRTNRLWWVLEHNKIVFKGKEVEDIIKWFRTLELLQVA